MKCIFCNYEDTQVIDSRINDDKTTIKRRRRCLKCDRRFNTLEKIELQMPMVIKNNGSRQEYDEDKIRSSFTKALHKRPVSSIAIDDAIDEIRQQVIADSDREISSRYLGDMVMAKLAKLDYVAYIRFASIYRQFQDITDFSALIEQVYQKVTNK